MNSDGDTAAALAEAGCGVEPATRHVQREHLVPPSTSPVAAGIVYTDFFRFINDRLHPRAYFEIGTHLGRSVKEFSCDAVCVDPNFMLDQDVITARGQTHFYQMPSDQFFASYSLRNIFPNGPDVCFLDGMHRSEYLLRDFMNTERSCHERSIIFLHDCLPANARMTLRTHVAGDPAEGDWQHAWTGDVWKVVPLLQAHRPDLKLFYLDCAPTGLIAISNLNPNSTKLSAIYSDLIDQLRELSLDSYTIQKLWDSLPVIDTRSLISNPEDLTLFLNIY